MIESVFWSRFIEQFLPSIPFLAIDSIGIILSIIFLRRNRKKFALTLISFLIFIISDISSIYINALLFEKLSSTHMSLVQMGNYMDTFFICVSAPLSVIGWIILLIAIFSPKLDSIASTEPNSLAKTESN